MREVKGVAPRRKVGMGLSRGCNYQTEGAKAWLRSSGNSRIGDAPGGERLGEIEMEATANPGEGRETAKEED